MVAHVWRILSALKNEDPTVRFPCQVSKEWQKSSRTRALYAARLCICHPVAIIKGWSCSLANADTMVTQLIEIIGFIEVEN